MARLIGSTFGAPRGGVARRNSRLWLSLGFFALMGCGGTENRAAPDNTGGAGAVGGASSYGGSPTTTGGAVPTTTTATASHATGGALGSGGLGSSTGGRATAGGATATGGFGIATGGTSSVGTSSMGGSKASGGSNATGGLVATGGSQAAAGASASGGKPASGGASASGGQSAMGGMSASGGTGATGGKPATGGTSSSGGSTGKGKFHVFVLLGQSNMAGYPKAQNEDKVKDSRIQVLGFDACSATGRQQDKWDVAVPPLHECWNGALGPGDYFSKTLISVVPASDTIGLVPCALSGQAIEVMMKVGGSKYDWILNRAKAAQQAGGVIEGFLFHQGESNCGDSAWPGKVKTFITDLRTDLNVGNAPFLAGELAPTGNCSQHNKLVAQLPGLITNAYVVSAQGLVLDPADTTYRVHFDRTSQITFGKRYEASLVQALGW